MGQTFGQERALPLSVSQEPGRTLRLSMLSEALVWLAPQAGIEETAGQGRYADGKDTAGTAKARDGRETLRFSNDREIPASLEFLKMNKQYPQHTGNCQSCIRRVYLFFALCPRIFRGSSFLNPRKEGQQI